MRKMCLVLLCALMAITLFSACDVIQSTRSGATPSFNASESYIIRSVTDNLLFENFPILSIATVADNRISITINRSDEEKDEMVDEILSFLSDTIKKHPDLSGMNIDMRVFHFYGTGPTVRIPVADNELKPVDFPALPEAKPVTLEYATEVFEAWWGEWGTVHFAGEETITRVRERHPDIQNFNDFFYTDLPEPIDVFVFELNDVRLGISKKCGAIFDYEYTWDAEGTRSAGGWSRGGNVLHRDESMIAPQMHVEDVTSTGLSFFFSNQTDTEFTYGADFSLYVREDDMWRFMNPGSFFTSEGYTIPQLSQTVPMIMNFSWVIEDDELAPGEYKFTKRLLSQSDFSYHTVEQRFIIG